MQTCTCCGTSQPLDSFYVQRSGARQTQCKPCLYVKQRARVLKNADSVARYQAAYQEKHADRLKEYRRQYGIDHAARLKAIRDADKDARSQYNREYHAARKEEINRRQREYKAANRHLAQEYRAANMDREKERRKAWAAENKHLLNAKAAKRRFALRNAFPAWADLDAIAEVYKMAKDGDRMHVDHIVPLQSNLVCGLHVACNLQILPASDNLSKSNRIWPDMWETS